MSARPNESPAYGGWPAGPRPKNYLIEAIFVTLCCCLPLGIAAIVYASRVDPTYHSGNYAASVQASNQARSYVIMGLVGGLIASIIWAIMLVSQLKGLMPGV
jgi:hypothetical protein